MGYVEAGGLQIHETLHRFVEEEALPGTGIEAKAFWRSLGELIERTPVLRELDAWGRQP